jgi:hypothetical protein
VDERFKRLNGGVAGVFSFYTSMVFHSDTNFIICSRSYRCRTLEAKTFARCCLAGSGLVKTNSSYLFGCTDLDAGKNGVYVNTKL